MTTRALAFDPAMPAVSSYFFNPSVGMMAKQPHMPPEMPSFWLPYFLVTDVDASAEKVKSLGGQIHMGPQDIPGTGRFAVIQDPQGAAFCMFTPKGA